MDYGEGNVKNTLTVAVYKKPSALIFKGEVNSTMSGYVCGSCGFVEMYVDEPFKLLNADSVSRRNA